MQIYIIYIGDWLSLSHGQKYTTSSSSSSTLGYDFTTGPHTIITPSSNQSLPLFSFRSSYDVIATVLLTLKDTCQKLKLVHSVCVCSMYIHSLSHTHAMDYNTLYIIFSL